MVLGGADEGAAGLDDLTTPELVVEHPATDAVAGLDQQHRAALAGHLPGGDQAGDAGADHDHVDLAGQRTAQAAGALPGSVGGELGEGAETERGAERAADERATGEEGAGHRGSWVVKPECVSCSVS